MNRFFRNFSGWTEPIHSVLDRNFRKFWLNGSRPEITIWGLKIERRNTNQCLSGVRIKDQGVQSAQTFLVKSLFFLQPPRKHDDQSAFKKVLNSDRGFVAASRTLETKMVMYIITAKLNLTFGTTCKAMAVKRLQKWSVETYEG